jgi:tryptophan synthase beta chain
VSYRVDERGYFGEFGGAFVPEMLRANVDALARQYRGIIESTGFQKEFRTLLKDYAGRPTPLGEAKRLSSGVGTRVLLKREDLNHTGSHKLNNTLGQILVAKRLGKRRIIAETGAGQHGVATATVCALLGFECVVFMGAVDMERQAPNVDRMRFLGAEVVPVTAGSRTLKDAANEALRDWIRNPEETHYIIGSAVGPHPYPDMVARFQSVISEEMQVQLRDDFGLERPSAVVACVGGGSNAIGGFYHFLEDGAVRLIGAEAAGEGIATDRSAATLALGRPGVLHGSATMIMQDSGGQILEAHSISAGLDYPGVGPQHAHLHRTGRAEYIPVTDTEALRAAKLLARTEGIIPALESAHAVAAIEKGGFGPSDTVVVILSGRGDKDMAAYGDGK